MRWLTTEYVLKGVYLGLILCAALAALLLTVFGKAEFLQEEFKQIRDSLVDPTVALDTTVFGVQLLLGIPFFYVLTFAGQEEESEIEIGAMCATFAVAVPMLFGEVGSFSPDAAPRAVAALILGS